MSFYRHGKLYADDTRPINGVLTPDVPLPGTHFRAGDGYIYKAIHEPTHDCGIVEHDTGSDTFGFHGSYREVSSLCSPSRRSASPQLVSEIMSGHSVWAVPADTNRKMTYMQEVDARMSKVWFSPLKPPWEGENATYAATLKANVPDWLKGTKVRRETSPANIFCELVHEYNELEANTSPPVPKAVAVSKPVVYAKAVHPDVSPTAIRSAKAVHPDVSPIAIRSAKAIHPNVSPIATRTNELNAANTPPSVPKPVAVSVPVQLELEPVDPAQPVTEQPIQSVSARRPPRRRKRKSGHRYHARTRRIPQRYTQPSFPDEYGDAPIPVFIPERKPTGHTVSTLSPQYDYAETVVPGW